MRHAAIVLILCCSWSAARASVVIPEEPARYIKKARAIAEVRVVKVSETKSRCAVTKVATMAVVKAVRGTIAAGTTATYRQVWFIYRPGCPSVSYFVPPTAHGTWSKGTTLIATLEGSGATLRIGATLSHNAWRRHLRGNRPVPSPQPRPGKR